MSRRMLAVVAIAVLGVALAGAYLVASLTQVAADHHDAAAALKEARQRNNNVYAALADPKLKAQLNSADDVKSAADALGEARARIGGSTRQVEEVSAELRAQESRLRRDRQSPLTLAGRGQLDQDLDRVAAVRRAFDAADRLLTTEDSHLKAINTVVAALLRLDAVSSWVRAGNVPQAVLLVPSVKQTLQDAATLSQGSGYPPQLRPLIDALKQLVDHFGALLDALQANNLAAAQTLDDALRADSAKLASSFDVDAFDSYERDALAPYRSEYESQMAKAGIKLTVK